MSRYQQTRAALAATAAEHLASLGLPPQPFVVAVEAGDDVHRITCRCWPAPCPGTPCTVPRDSPESENLGLWLSPLERRIVEALSSGEWMPTRQIAQAIGEDGDGDIRAILRNLVERQILESLTAKGFRLCAIYCVPPGTQV